eukprot:symbB.v1.2.011035.t1/scaffold733.1/size168030/6
MSCRSSPISWPVPQRQFQVQDGTVLVQERPITPRGVAGGTRTVTGRSMEEPQTRWPCWKTGLSLGLRGCVTSWKQKRQVPSHHLLVMSDPLEALDRFGPRRQEGGVAAVTALVRMERVLQPFLQGSGPQSSTAQVVSPRQIAPTGATGKAPAPNAARTSFPKASLKVGHSASAMPARHSLGRSSVHKVYSGPGGKASARFTEVTDEVLGPRVYSECNLTRSGQTALSAIMSSPRSNLMPDALSRSSPVGQMEIRRASGIQVDSERWIPHEEAGLDGNFQRYQRIVVCGQAVHARLDRMQELLNQAQKHTAEQLRYLKADFEELERLRAEDPDGGGGDNFSSSSSSSEDDESS